MSIQNLAIVFGPLFGQVGPGNRSMTRHGNGVMTDARLYAHAVPLSWLHAYNSEVRHGATRISTMSIDEHRVGGDA